jgi:hypothetical protein
MLNRWNSFRLSTTNGNIHIDDPQDPGGALSDENSDFWDDYE